MDIMQQSRKLRSGVKKKSRLSDTSRSTVEIPEINIIHFGGEMKLWDRDHLGPQGQKVYDAEFAEKVLCSNQPWNTKLWFQRNGTEAEYATFGLN